MKKLLILVFLLVIVSSCGYKNVIQKSEVQSITDILYTIEAVATNIEEGTEDKRSFTSFHIGDGYLVTCAHCVEYAPFGQERTPFGVVDVPTIDTTPRYTYKGLKVTLIGTKEDVAVLYLEELKDSLIIDFSQKDTNVGDFVMMGGNSFMKGVNFKAGFISINPVDFDFLDYTKEFLKNSFVVFCDINPGDSGSPVFVVDKFSQELYIGGMVYASSLGSSYGFCVKSDYVQELIKDIKER